MSELKSEVEGYAASLRQQAQWIDEAVNGTVPVYARIDLGDIDTDELRAAADFIERQGCSQPAPTAQEPDELSELGDELNALFDQYLNSHVASLRDSAAIRLRAALWDNKAGIIARLRAPRDPSSTATTASAEPVGWAPFSKEFGWDLSCSFRHQADAEATISTRPRWTVRALYDHASPPPPADTVREALERLEADARSPQQLYDRSGASFTSPGGTEYEFTSAHLDKCNELADSVAAIIAALSSTAPIEAGWREIETAPKVDAEGRAIEIMVAGGTYYDSSETYGSHYQHDGWSLACWDKVHSEWRGEQTETYGEFIYYQPTHWMPKIPAPPRKERGAP